MRTSFLILLSIVFTCSAASAQQATQPRPPQTQQQTPEQFALHKQSLLNHLQIVFACVQSAQNYEQMRSCHAQSSPELPTQQNGTAQTQRQ